MTAFLEKLIGPLLKARGVRQREEALAREIRARRRGDGQHPAPGGSLAHGQGLTPPVSPERPAGPEVAPELAADVSGAEIARCLAQLSPSPSIPDQDLAEIFESPLASALSRHLETHYPNLKEYQGLILAEIVELTMTGSGGRSLAQNPDAFVEMAVKRAMVCLAQVRVALRRAVREELGARPKPGPDSLEEPAQESGRDKA